MKYLSAILTALNAIKQIWALFSKKSDEKAKKEETKNVDTLKKETEKNIKDGNIDAINDKLRF